MSDTPLFALRDFHVRFATPRGVVHAVNGVTLAVAKGETLGVVGESGSGKSQTFLAALGLAPSNARASGAAFFEGKPILGLRRPALDALRGRRIGFVFQDPLSALTPHLTIGAQMAEGLGKHLNLHGPEALTECREWLDKVQIANARRRLQQYPHELSGGMRQRVMLAAAMMLRPELLIADEPTTALDATIQAQALDLMDELRRESGASLILITHDMGVIARMADRVCVMSQGRIVEEGAAAAIFEAPAAEETKGLIAAAPRLAAPRFEKAPPPPANAKTALTVEGLDVRFTVRGETPLAKPKVLRAVDGVSFDLKSGETLGVVGESGSGKSSLARAVLRLVPAKEGAVAFLGADLLGANAKALSAARRDMQIVFQDPFASLDPRFTLGRAIAEPLEIHAPHLSSGVRAARMREAMARVGLDPALEDRFPHELSGGQCQRVGIARAIVLEPKLVICDEAVSALDVTIQAQILKLLIDVQKTMGLSLLFISHDLAVVREIAHRVMVMYMGRVVEIGPTEAVFANPLHPYARALLGAVLPPDPQAARARPRIAPDREIPSPFDTRSALRYLKSKMIDNADAAQYRPALKQVSPGRFVAEFDPEPAAA